MAVPVVTFFNNKGGVGKTSLVYHLSWMLSETDRKVLVCDLDPQANLSAAFLDEDLLETLWNDEASDQEAGNTISQCVRPLMQVTDLLQAQVQQITPNLSLIPGDLSLAVFEDTLSDAWPKAFDSNPYRSFRLLTAFSTIMQQAAKNTGVSLILADVGPNLGAINRSALIATDYVAVPLGADLFSLQGLRNLGPTLSTWREEWGKRKENWKQPAFPLPEGRMKPIGYVVQQHGIRLSRPVKAYDKWVNRMPGEYAKNLLDNDSGGYPATPLGDDNCLATIKHYRSLVPLAQEARKPIFKLTPADGAIGSHAAATRDAYTDFKDLADKIDSRISQA